MPVAGLLLKPTRNSSAADVHAIQIGTLPLADRVITVRRPCNLGGRGSLRSALIAAKLVPGFGRPIRMARIALVSRANEVC